MIRFDAAHKAVYDCTPGSEWLRATPIKVPRDRLWTAKDDELAATNCNDS